MSSKRATTLIHYLRYHQRKTYLEHK